MVVRKDVFISATSADLGSYRQVAKEALLSLGAHPIEEQSFPTDYHELQALLARRLDPCDAVIHLVGFHYGGEPNPTSDLPRRSWTQWEYYRTTESEHPKSVYRFLAREDCAFDARPDEDAERQRLQHEHRRRLMAPGGPIYYEFSTPQELQELILKIDELRELVRVRLVHMPFLPLRGKFTGRLALLKSLQQDLTAGGAWVIAQPVSVHADGGVGKTALAVEVGWRLFEALKFDFVLFLNASTPETLQTELASLVAADALHLPTQSVEEHETRRAAVMRWLATPENARRSLLILDNVDSDEARQAVRELLPKVALCAILITSRYGGDLSGVLKQELALFTPEEAREYLRSHLHAGLLAQSDGEATLDALAQEVDHLPLALELVTSYLHETRQSPAEWLEEWRQSPVPTLEFHDVDGVNYPVSLARVWERSVERLSPDARALLHGLAWIAPRPAALPLQVLKARGDWSGQRAALSELAKVSLIGWPAGGEEIFIHRVLQAVTRQGLSEEEKTASLESALAQIGASLPKPKWNEAGWRLWERLAPHVRALLDQVQGVPTEPAAASIMNQYGLWLYHRGQYPEAEPLFERACSILEKDPEGPELADVLRNLAVLHRRQSRYEEAKPLFERALSIWEKVRGPEDPEVAHVLRNRGVLYRHEHEKAEEHFKPGLYEKAEKDFERALSIWENAADRESPELGRVLYDFAELYRQRGPYKEVERLFTEACSTLEKALGPTHWHVGRVRSDLAELYRQRGRYEEAEPLFKKALPILEGALPEHPEVATCLKNYSLCLRAMNRPEEAMSLEARARAIRTKRAEASSPLHTLRLQD